jgi:hypothetical protein
VEIYEAVETAWLTVLESVENERISVFERDLPAAMRPYAHSVFTFLKERRSYLKAGIGRPRYR